MYWFMGHDEVLADHTSPDCSLVDIQAENILLLHKAPTEISKTIGGGWKSQLLRETKRD